MALETGWRPEATTALVFEGYTYDPRQTDHAWVESRAYVTTVNAEQAPESFTPGGAFDDVKWWPLDATTANRVPAGQAIFLREGVKHLRANGLMDEATADAFLAKTG